MYNVILGFFISCCTGEETAIFAGTPGDILARNATAGRYPFNVFLCQNIIK